MPAEQFRRDRMLELADLVSGRGLEIGPLDRAIAVKPDFDVRYVDVYDAPAIRAHYQDHPLVDIRQIPDIDFALHTPEGQIQTLVEAVADAAPFRWVLASHVVEHVPDLIGWLRDIAEVLEDGGRLVLAIPDRRYTFDSLRPQTTVGQMLQAHLNDDRTPAIRAVFDHFRSAVHVSADERWAGKEVGEKDVIHGLVEAMEKVEQAQKEYVDCHVWLFTPTEFVAAVTDLGDMGLCELYLSAVLPTAPGEIEYYVALSRIPRACSKSEAARIRKLSRERLVIPHVPSIVSPESGPAKSTASGQHNGRHNGGGHSDGSNGDRQNGGHPSSGPSSSGHSSSGHSSGKHNGHHALTGTESSDSKDGAAGVADRPTQDAAVENPSAGDTAAEPATRSAANSRAIASTPNGPDMSVSQLEVKLILAKRRIIGTLLRREKPVKTP